MSKRRDKFRDMTIEARLEMIENIYVRYPKPEHLLEQIDFCRLFSKTSAEPEGMLITGPPGAGKTTLHKRYAQRFPRVATAEVTLTPVLAVSVPVPATVKNLATHLLAELGDPIASKGTTGNQTLRLCHFLKECRVELIILDEFQHFIDRESLKVLRTISDWLKNLMNDARMPIVLIGMPKSEAVLDEQENAQLKRRFPTRESLSAFGWDTEERQQEFRKFLGALDESLPLADSSNLADLGTAFRIHRATGGVVNNVMKLIRRAAALALRQGAESVDSELLARAYEERLSSQNPSMPNPFYDDDGDSGGAAAGRNPKGPSACAATNKRIKSRKEEEPLSAILSQR